MDDQDLLRRLATALSIGLLVGLERGWRTREEADGQRAAGLRTFGLSGLLGGVCGALAGVLGPLVLGFGLLAYAGVLTAFSWLEAHKDRTASATTTVAGLLTFALGAYAAVGSLPVAVAGAVAMTVLLALREQLHGLVRTLTFEEIRAVLILLAMTFLLLPVLPDRTIDPWDALNPARIWVLAILMAAISFGGYVAVRLFGDRLGVTMAALAGGLASSTATTLALARLGRGHPASSTLLASGILAAGAVMVVRVGAVAGVLNRGLAADLVPPVAATAGVLAAGAAVMMAGTRGTARPRLEIASPLDLGTTVRLSLFIAVVLVAARILEDLVGATGVYVVAALSGVADVDAVTISMSEYARTPGGEATAVGAIALAVAVNTLAKAVMAGWVGGVRIGLPVLAVGVLAIAAGVAALDVAGPFLSFADGGTP